MDDNLMVRILIELCVRYLVYSIRYGIEYKSDTLPFGIHKLSLDIHQMSGWEMEGMIDYKSIGISSSMM